MLNSVIGRGKHPAESTLAAISSLALPLSRRLPNLRPNQQIQIFTAVQTSFLELVRIEPVLLDYPVHGP